jgi:hypothetical protein
MSATYLSNCGQNVCAQRALRAAVVLLALGAVLFPLRASAAETTPTPKQLEALTKAFAAQDAKD